MDTKWKNKILFAAWILLLAFGLSGILSVFLHGGDYFKRDYFQTAQFEGQLNQFVHYLSMFELNYMSPEEAKKGITVSVDEINEHRYRYGNLAAQIADIKGQYEQKIQEALQSQNKELADIYIADRDKKIEDITNNFKSDEYVRAKIIKEKEQKVDQYYRELETSRPEFLKLKTGFKYYLKDTATGEVCTNLGGEGSEVNKLINKLINNKNMLFIRNYPTSKQGYLVTSAERLPLFESTDPSLKKAPVSEYSDKSGNTGGILITKNERTFEGKIAVPKAAPETNLVLANYQDFQRKQKIFFIYTISCIIALLLGFYLSKKTPVRELIAVGKWQSYYNRIPIDVSAVILAFCSLITFLGLINNNALYFYEYLYSFIREACFDLIFTAPFLALTVIQGNLLFERVKVLPDLQTEWQKSLLSRAYQGLKEAFLIRSTGTQILIILLLVFVSGSGAGFVVIQPRLILLYVPIFLVIGIPLIIVIVKRTGYFNHIVTNTGEVVRGKLEQDLPVVGKSTLAILADNINTLKHGVKISRREQAKSERFKTELITNVSHDLRTPLTSIITYTELLKTPNLTEEDSVAYIQIIDRKSKRLKVLIDDLFEASKMASGSIELVQEKVDLIQLLQQAMAEHNEAISESTLHFRIKKPDKPVYAIVDGQKLWRVFDNLIGNILKYSLENTRVYITLKALPGKAVIVFKNVTKYELSEDVDELFERFKRGDKSRHTEGSGLGLAIAKSIIDLHGGSLDIEVDGDLFKITVALNTLLD